MAAGSGGAIICDTGALLDYLVKTAPDHRLFRNAIDGARTRYVPGLVLAELDYFLWVNVIGDGRSDLLEGLRRCL